MHPLLKKIYHRLGGQVVPDSIATELSGSEFNTLQLELFRRRAETLRPADLLESFEQNRFVQPAAIDAIRSRELELDWLKQAVATGFEAITLSPVAPLGACSAVGPVHQNKVLSSLRGTEVVADATNVLALLIAQESKRPGNERRLFRYATTHRHVRTQALANPAFTAHFSVFCLVSGGPDTGNLAFEKQQLATHAGLLLQLIRRSFPFARPGLKFMLQQPNPALSAFIASADWGGIPVETVIDPGIYPYYQTIRFRIYLDVGGQSIDIADGGLVDWTQKLLNNRKHRAMISGIGLELLQKLPMGDTP